MTDWEISVSNENPEPIIKIGNKLFMQTRNAQYITDDKGLSFYRVETREVTESELKLLGEIDELKETLAAVNMQLLNSI